MRYFIPLALVGGLVAATPAMAQSTEQEPFTGPRVEVITGYDSLRGNSGGGHESTDGLLYGIGAGYDKQFGSVIGGIEGEVAGSTSKFSSYDIYQPGDSARLRPSRDLYIGARVGMAVAPSTLLYVKGGYTNLRINERYFDGLGDVFKDHSTLDGYRVGAGVEHKLTSLGSNSFVKLEYRYSHYSNFNAVNYNGDVNLDRHQVVAGFGIRF
jgi:outer membrane immunogenic protein